MKSDFFISPNYSIQDAMKQLNETQGMGLVVVDESNRLLGTLTDGDIRRALLSGARLEDSIDQSMCRNPLVLLEGENREEILNKAKAKLLKIIPMLNNARIIIEIVFVDGHSSVNDTPVVIMAGGLGARLGELTKDCPKPMLKIGSKHILEIIIDRLKAQGFSNFYISVNYKAQMIEDYFGDGKKSNCSIKYLREDKRLGTAGALSLLSDTITGPVIVINGDVLTWVDLRNLKEFHETHDSPLTICVRKYDFKVPYGVINIENHAVLSLDEKPTQSFFVNAGVYVINSTLFKYLPENEYYDMTTFVEDLMKKKINILCFPIVEKWIDIGQVDDLKNAREEYGKIF